MSIEQAVELARKNPKALFDANTHVYLSGDKVMVVPKGQKGVAKKARPKGASPIHAVYKRNGQVTLVVAPSAHIGKAEELRQAVIQGLTGKDEFVAWRLGGTFEKDVMVLEDKGPRKEYIKGAVTPILQFVGDDDMPTISGETKGRRPVNVELAAA